MSLSYYDTGRKPRLFLARLWICANVVLACAMSLYWTVFAVSVGEPFRWAMRDSLSPQPQLLEFPYMLLWSMPLVCMMIGWAAMQLRQEAVARIVGGYPTVMLALMISWYNLAPSHWH